MTKEEKVYKKAQEFLHDLELKKNLQTLQKKIGGLNVFSILKTERTEIRHSNVLAWLVDPFGNHGLGTQFAEVFFVNISNAVKGNEKFISKLVLDGLNDITVYREKDNIDVLVVSNCTKQVVVIENKTGSAIHDDQLNRYESIVNEIYPDHDKLFLYLDSNQDFSGDIGKWQYVNYAVVKSSLEYFIDGELNDKLKIILQDYLTIIRRTLMNDIDKDTQALCDRIYEKYREVIDFIVANKANMKSKFLETVLQLLTANAEKLNIVIEPKWSDGNFIRFAVKGMQVISNKDEGWAKDQMLLLEISGNPYTGSAFLQLAVYLGKNQDNAKIRTIIDALPKKKRSDSFRTYQNTKITWNGELNSAADKQELLKELERIINGKNMQELFNQIKAII